ncbi:TRAP transporter large permease [Roseicella aerolata]|uniref:TRAP transporter large permease protein n=1 Tax=Roseicella aerolata TaxID=2883479 RepID=A0A9X1I962_9PROT|nr:TRAP transporter large permease subunit [Roseicella aerolata]MCB4820212.1 TRAP transporter large permease subunit [Roseicella aerolata]
MSSLLLGEILAIALFLAGTFGVLLGYPIAFSLAGFSLIFAGLGWALGVFDPIILTSLPSRYFGLMTNEVLVAVPLFIFMGAVLERSKIAEALLETMGQLFGTMRGGLAISVVIVGALLAASTGVVGATVVTMGLLSLPAMMRAGYDPKLATGVICASGTLGQIIPPSVILIFIGDLLMGANQLAAQRTGRPVDPVSVGDLFVGAFLPGLGIVALYILYVIGMAVVRPASCPALQMDEAERASLGRRFLRALVPPLLLIVAVLGSILVGLATPTEAASIGAIGAVVLAALNRALSFRMMLGVMRNTAVISALVFGIVLGVSVFSLVFRGLGGEHLVEQALLGMPGGTIGAVVGVMLVMFVLGFFMDTIEIVLIVVPITAPAIIAMGVDPLWLGVMIGINLQTAFLTPPVGFALFYMRAVAPASITTGDIYRGIIPFVCLQAIALAALWLVPQTATWLPKVVFPDAVPAAAAPGGGGSVLDDILQAPMGGGTPAPSGSPLDQLLSPPPPGDRQPEGDPVLDRLLRGG